jgi:hypothetical protein
VLSPIETRLSAGTPATTASDLTVPSGGLTTPVVEVGSPTAPPDGPTTHPTGALLTPCSGLTAPLDGLIIYVAEVGGPTLTTRSTDDSGINLHA